MSLLEVLAIVFFPRERVIPVLDLRESAAAFEGFVLKLLEELVAAIAKSRNNTEPKRIAEKRPDDPEQPEDRHHTEHYRQQRKNYFNELHPAIPHLKRIYELRRNIVPKENSCSVVVTPVKCQVYSIASVWDFLRTDMLTKPTLIVLFIASLTFFGFILTPRSATTQSNEAREKFKNDVRDGLAEIGLPMNPIETEIDAAGDRLADFVEYRSGVKISKANLARLKELEFNFRSTNKGVSVRELSQHLTRIAVDRIPKLKDDEIVFIAENLKGFYFPEIPEGFKKGRETITLRADGRGWMNEDIFVKELKTLRDSGVGAVMRQIFAYELGREVTNKVQFLAEVEPSRFGAGDSALSPMEALLVVYSLAAEDPLAHGQKGLKDRMIKHQEVFTRHTGVKWPDPNLHRAYGTNGYIRPSPVELLLDDATVTEILKLFPN